MTLWADDQIVMRLGCACPPKNIGALGNLFSLRQRKNVFGLSDDVVKKREYRMIEQLLMIPRDALNGKQIGTEPTEHTGKNNSPNLQLEHVARVLLHLFSSRR